VADGLARFSRSSNRRRQRLTASPRGLGCAPSAGCDIPTLFDHISVGIRASQPLAALIDGSIISGGIEVSGGGANCNSSVLFVGSHRPAHCADGAMTLAYYARQIA
jgi:hypothetical protein